MTFLGILLVQSSWIFRIVDAQTEDSWIQTHKREIIQEPNSDWTIDTYGYLRMKCLLVVLDILQFKKLFGEAYCAKYTVHLGTTKMCKDLKRNF